MRTSVCWCSMKIEINFIEFIYSIRIAFAYFPKIKEKFTYLITVCEMVCDPGLRKQSKYQVIY